HFQIEAIVRVSLSLQQSVISAPGGRPPPRRLPQARVAATLGTSCAAPKRRLRHRCSRRRASTARCFNLRLPTPRHQPSRDPLPTPLGAPLPPSVPQIAPAEPGKETGRVRPKGPRALRLPSPTPPWPIATAERPAPRAQRAAHRATRA